MTGGKEVIIIVDAFLSGAYYAPAFNRVGYQCLHVDTERAPSVHRHLNESLYIENIIYRGNINELLHQLNKYNIKAVIAGSETGVELTDLVASHFDVLKNNHATTKIRRNKFLMVEALRKNNVPCAQQFCANKLEPILNWYANFGQQKVILKPTLSASSDSVAICHNKNEIVEHFKNTINQKNYIGFSNDSLVIQEYLHGDEYFVNTVSCNGEHFITDIWRGVGGKANTISTDQYAELIRKEDDTFLSISNYVKSVLDAVELNNGPAHTEVKCTPNGIKLIEVNARISGLLDFSIVKECQQYSQLSLAVETYVSPSLFNKKIESCKNLKQKKMWLVYLSSPISGTVNQAPNADMFLALDSVKSVKFNVKKGDLLLKTDASIGRPGYITLMSDSVNELQDDYMCLREMEIDLYHSILQ